MTGECVVSRAGARLGVEVKFAPHRPCKLRCELSRSVSGQRRTLGRIPEQTGMSPELDHPVTCTGCGRATWNPDALCGACKAAG